MQLKTSAEMSVEVYLPVMSMKKLVDPYINSAFSASSLSILDWTILYVPIIMPEDVAIRYTARSRLWRRQRRYDCSPQLRHAVFLSGQLKAQLAEYVDGLAETRKRLPEMGASPQQIADFELTVSTAAQTILDRVAVNGMPPVPSIQR